MILVLHWSLAGIVSYADVVLVIALHCGMYVVASDIL